MFLLITYDYSLLFRKPRSFSFSIIGYILHNIYQIKIKKNKDIHINLIAIFVIKFINLDKTRRGVLFFIFNHNFVFVFKTDVKKNSCSFL